MSYRGGGRGGYATGANRGGSFGGRGGELELSRSLEVEVIWANEIFRRTGRGGFSAPMGPPAQVLGNYYR